MITRDNIKDILSLLTKDRKQMIYYSKDEYLRVDCSFFNLGMSIRVKSMDNLPYDLDELVLTGNTAFITIEEAQQLI